MTLVPSNNVICKSRLNSYWPRPQSRPETGRLRKATNSCLRRAAGRSTEAPALDRPRCRLQASDVDSEPSKRQKHHAEKWKLNFQSVNAGIQLTLGAPAAHGSRCGTRRYCLLCSVRSSFSCSVQLQIATQQDIAALAGALEVG